MKRRAEELIFTPQRSFYRGGKRNRSISFRQVPDLVIEHIDADAKTRIFILDPKYKLAIDGQPQQVNDDTAEGLGKIWSDGPTKADIDKMHTYSDAIRGADGSRIVEFAGILFPGQSSEYFGTTIAAIAAHPARTDALALELNTLFERFVQSRDSKIVALNSMSPSAAAASLQAPFPSQGPR